MHTELPSSGPKRHFQIPSLKEVMFAVSRRGVGSKSPSTPGIYAYILFREMLGCLCN